MIQADSESQGWSYGQVRCSAGGGGLGQRVLGWKGVKGVWGHGARRKDNGETGKLQLAEEKRKKGMGWIFCFGSEVGVVVALAQLSSVVPSISVAVPLVLPALPPALVVVAPVAVGSSGWWSKQSGGDRR